MEATEGTPESTAATPEEADSPRICAYGTSEKRTVFTESGNGDGWIATDLTVEPTQ